MKKLTKITFVSALACVALSGGVFAATGVRKAAVNAEIAASQEIAVESVAVLR